MPTPLSEAQEQKLKFDRLIKKEINQVKKLDQLKDALMSVKKRQVKQQCLLTQEIKNRMCKSKHRHESLNEDESYQITLPPGVKKRTAISNQSDEEFNVNPRKINVQKGVMFQDIVESSDESTVPNSPNNRH